MVHVRSELTDTGRIKECESANPGDFLWQLDGNMCWQVEQIIDAYQTMGLKRADQVNMDETASVWPQLLPSHSHAKSQTL